MSKYAAKIENGAVTQVIRGDADWAAERLGGDWLPSEEKVGQGWLVVEGQIVPPPVTEFDELES